MSNVVGLRPDPKIWVCWCGCSTFELLSTGAARCAHCEAVSWEGHDGWFPEIADAGDRSPDEPEPVRDVQGNRSVEFARRRIEQLAAEPDVVTLILVKGDGTVSTWSCVEQADQMEWLRGRVDDALGLIAGGVTG